MVHLGEQALVPSSTVLWHKGLLLLSDYYYYCALPHLLKFCRVYGREVLPDLWLRVAVAFYICLTFLLTPTPCFLDFGLAPTRV